MKPMLLWLEHVLGFEQLWEVAFHTSDVDPKRKTGSGLKSIVMWDPESSMKFANNEPARPFFKSSQINIFNEELRGDGVQHVALTVGDILGAVRALRGNGVDVHADAGQLLRHAARAHREDAASSRSTRTSRSLRELEILVDGDHHHAVHAADLPQGVGGPLRRPDARARSSTRSSSARATAASAPATSARCSRASSASSSERGVV